MNASVYADWRDFPAPVGLEETARKISSNEALECPPPPPLEWCRREMLSYEGEGGEGGREEGRRGGGEGGEGGREGGREGGGEGGREGEEEMEKA